jgi:PTS system nitrogen regulatory IIA component
MEISELLIANAVKSVTTVSSKKMVLHTLSELAAQAHGIDPEASLRALQDRENLGPTGVGHGVALPHARIPNIESVCTVFIRLERPIDLFFGLFAPEEAGVEHLKALALISRTMRDAAICAKLRANTDSETLHTIITEAQRQQAA